jgi:hypothetical protein
VHKVPSSFLCINDFLGFFRKLEAEVARYCAKYGLALLEFSHCKKLTEQVKLSQKQNYTVKTNRLGKIYFLNVFNSLKIIFFKVKNVNIM